MLLCPCVSMLNNIPSEYAAAGPAVNTGGALTPASVNLNATSLSPFARLPWHIAQLVANNLPPASVTDAWFSSVSIGFVAADNCSGVCMTSRPWIGTLPEGVGTAGGSCVLYDCW